MQRAATAPAGAIALSRFAMRLSLAFGVLLLAGKWGAYFYTNSAAILADSMESVIHVVAVAFAAFSLDLSSRPADSRFLFGYERITFFSAGFEGALIILAAGSIIVAAIQKWLSGAPLENVGAGALVAFIVAVVNAALGLYLVHVGRQAGSLILEANGRHVLTDSWTSLGVMLGLALVLLTGWKPFDPLCAMVTAINISWSGGHLVRRSVSGLLDYSDPDTGRLLREKLDALCRELGLHYHGVRFRHMGYRIRVEIHLLFPYDVALGEAHRLATTLEEKLPEQMGMPVEVVTHLESLEDHGEVHRGAHYTGRPA